MILKLKNKLRCKTKLIIISSITFFFNPISSEGQDHLGNRGCTTILVGKQASADGSVILGHNEDMGKLSGRLLYQPRQKHHEKEVNLNYVTLPQVSETYRYWASGNSTPVANKYYDGGWILTGMNEFGVSLVCNTMTTREERIPKGKGIMRYSIRQLILERTKTAREAVNLIENLIDTYSQSDSPVAYCIVDQNEAWLVETTYRHWVARRIPDDEFHIVANQYTIKTEWDMASENLVNYATNQGWFDPSNGPFNFKKTYSDQNNFDQPGNTSREFQGNYMLNNKKGSITIQNVLTVLSQPPIQTTTTQSFMIMNLQKNLPPNLGYKLWYGMSGVNTNISIPIYMGSSKVPNEYMESSLIYDPKSAWWQFKRLQELIYPRWWEYNNNFLDVRNELDQYQKIIFQETTAIEEKAIEFYQQGNIKKADQLLTNHTYEKLQEALNKIKGIILNIDSN